MNLFYKYASAILGIAGLVTALLFCEIHKYIIEAYECMHNHFVVFLVVWSIIIGFLIGKIIHALHYMAYTDALTSLWNRRYFYIKLGEETNFKKGTGTSLCIALVDVDNFKSINNNFGHIEGDNVLVNIAEIFRKHTRSMDAVFRWGGDEFAILFPESTLAEAIKVSELIKKDIANNSQCHQATVSIGIIAIKEDWNDSNIMRKVDELLFKAKENKNLIVSFGS